MQDRAAWTGATIDYRTDGLHTLSAAEVEEIDAALAPSAQPGRSRLSRHHRRTRFPLPTLGGFFRGPARRAALRPRLRAAARHPARALLHRRHGADLLRSRRAYRRAAAAVLAGRTARPRHRRERHRAGRARLPRRRRAALPHRLLRRRVADVPARGEVRRRQPHRQRHRGASPPGARAARPAAGAVRRLHLPPPRGRCRTWQRRPGASHLGLRPQRRRDLGVSSPATTRTARSPRATR